MNQTTPKAPRYRLLDHWRGFLCLFVVVEHAAVALWPFLGDGTGPDGLVRIGLVRLLNLNCGTSLFFVISGYCIASGLASHRRKGGAPAAFLARRLWRIFPPYWAALGLFVGVVAGLDALGLAEWHAGGQALGLDSPDKLNAGQWLGNLTLTETWRPRAWGGGESSVYTRVAWSLCYQEQFYVVCVLALIACPKRLGVALAWLSAAVVALRAVLYDIGSDHVLDGYFPMMWHQFAVGLAVFARLEGGLGRWAGRAIDAGLALMIVAGLRAESNPTVAAAAFGLMLIALRRWDARLADLAALRPLAAVGRKSYSIYLTHLPIGLLVAEGLHRAGVDGFYTRLLTTLPLIVLASVAFGWAFDRWVDAHFHRLPNFRLPRRPTRPVVRPAVVTVRTAGSLG